MAIQPIERDQEEILKLLAENRELKQQIEILKIINAKYKKTISDHINQTLGDFENTVGG